MSKNETNETNPARDPEAIARARAHVATLKKMFAETTVIRKGKPS